MTVKTGQAWAGLFVCLDATGALEAGTPSGVLYVDGVADGATVTITGSNPYKWSVTLPSLTAGQRVDMYITATISTIATAGFVASEQADTTLLSDGVTLADDAITSAKFDESTAFPVKSADTGATAIARVGADSDTLKTLSDQIDAVKAETASILEDTGTTIPGTITTIDNEIAVIDGIVDSILEDTGTTLDTKINTIDDFLDTEVAAILADTNELQTDLTNGGRLDMLIDAIKAKTDNLPADPADDSDIDAQLAAIKAETALIVEDTATTIPATLATIEGKIDTADTVVDAIKAKTDNLPTDPADDSDIDTAIAAVKTVVDAILVDTGTTLDGKITAILADTNELQAELADGGRTDLLIDAILEDTGTTIPGTITTIDNEVAVIDGIVDAILADTNELQTDLTDGGRLDLLIDAIKTETASILEDTGTDGVVLTAGAVDAILDEVVVGTYTMRQLLTVFASALAGKLSGGGTTTLTFRGINDASDVIVATVDANGNRSDLTITV